MPTTAERILETYATQYGAYQAKKARCDSDNVKCGGKGAYQFFARTTLREIYDALGMPDKKEKVKKMTVEDIFAEVQKLGLQLAGVNQNVNTSNSTTAATAATSAAKTASGAVAGGFSTLLFIGAGLLIAFYFWKK